MKQEACCIVNGGGGAWAFAALAEQLSAALWLDVSETPREYNYLLHLDAPDPRILGKLFIPLHCMQLAADKRLLARRFEEYGVATPQTFLIPSLAEAERLLAEAPEREWCVKFPIGCGAAGHRLLRPGMVLPKEWPLPLVIQEFIRLERPEVYRTYAAGGELFGWVVRRFPQAVQPSPWVAHARGACYEDAGKAPPEASAAARAALEATNLLGSFGCVDLMQRPSGEWVVLEVGTDGMFNHVDRNLSLPAVELEIQRRLAVAFWSWVGEPPWGPGPWHPRVA